MKNGTSLIICIKFLAYPHWPANYQLLYTITVLSSLSFKDFFLIFTSSFLCLASYTTMLALTSPHESYLLSIILVIPYKSPTSYLLNQGNSLQHLSKILAFGSASHGTCFIQLRVPSCPLIPLPYYSCMLLEPWVWKRTPFIPHKNPSSTKINTDICLSSIHTCDQMKKILKHGYRC